MEEASGAGGAHEMEKVMMNTMTITTTMRMKMMRAIRGHFIVMSYQPAETEQPYNLVESWIDSPASECIPAAFSLVRCRWDGRVLCAGTMVNMAEMDSYLKHAFSMQYSVTALFLPLFPDTFTNHQKTSPNPVTSQ